MRNVIDVDGNERCYLVRRLKCPVCNRIHHELPNFIVPYKRYCVQVIEAAIEGKSIDLPCYDNTIANFKRWFESIVDKMTLLLRAGNSTNKDIPQNVSPLPFIKEMYGNANGWLAWAIVQTVHGIFWTRTTRLLC